MHAFTANLKLYGCWGHSNVIGDVKEPLSFVEKPFSGSLKPSRELHMCVRVLVLMVSKKACGEGVTYYLSPTHFALPMHKIKEACQGACDPSHGITTFRLKNNQSNPINSLI